MENIIHSCENCGHCDEDCPICMKVKQCEHYNPHELRINEMIDYSKIDYSADVCLGLDNKYHAVKCVEWIERK